MCGGNARRDKWNVEFEQKSGRGDQRYVLRRADMAASAIPERPFRWLNLREIEK
jgi:hypothetical protein